ncbi:YibE/F family protein [Vibrio sp. SCSIO 43136]|uniref:YibE/F family protein n=1 Tax=Vibrio sp. SCSIO 43136 TaxID=2819101 RepID=UPI002075EBD9|nr:YibE/F family protein [Vibrio sp. SCSIO 43136]USD67047.1 YibE/F family protein [Vibrio sp. SCSIO 43136]
MKRFIFPSIVFAIATAIFVMSPLWSESFRPAKVYKQEFVAATVTDVPAQNVRPDPKVPSVMTGTQTVIASIDGQESQRVQVENSLSRLHNTYLEPGDEFILLVRESGKELLYWVYNHDRAPAIYLMLTLLIVLVVVFGGLQGVNSLISLYFTAALIIGVLIPGLFAGWNPVLLALGLISLKVIVSFALITGWNKKSLVSILGTILGLVAAGICAQLFGEMAHLNGLYLEKGEDLLYLGGSHQIQVRWLLFVAIMISALGAVMDVAVSIASSYQELIEANPTQSVKERMFATMRIGRDILGTMTNTLILAFVGSSLTTMMMIWGFQMPHEQFINIPTIGLSIIHGLAGSIGLTLTIPMTVLLCKWVYERNS